MGLLDNIRNQLSKLRIASTGNTSQITPNIPVLPSMGQLEVVDTTRPPTSHNIPGSWSRSWMGPGQPFSPIDGGSARDQDTEHEPRSFQYVSSVNSTISPRIPYGLLPFSELRRYAESVPEVAMCVRLLVEELKAFVPTIVDAKEQKALPVDANPYRWMIDAPDGFNPWPVWLSKFLYNVLVYDAGAAYLIRSRKGGKITGSRVIDGSTIFVLINERGEQPKPPAPAFTQIIWGMPNIMLNTKQLWYKPRHLRTDAPYGRSPIEDALPAVKLLYSLWDYEYQKYQVGNIPETVFTVPDKWGDSVDQLLEFETAFNARMSGSNQERVRARFMPAGTSQLTSKEMSFNQQTYDAGTNAIRMAYGIPQSEVGDAPSGGLGGSGYAQAMQSAFFRMGLSPLISYIEGHFMDIIRANRDDNICTFKLEFPTESLDPQAEEEKWSSRFVSGAITRDEYRQGIKMTALGGEDGAFMISPGGGQAEGEDDGGDPFAGMFGDKGAGGLAGKKIPVINSNRVQVRRPINVLNKPVAAFRRPVKVSKIDGGTQHIVQIMQDLEYAGDPEAFVRGFNEELEHAETVNFDLETIGRIAVDHLREDPRYYDKLEQAMEKFTRDQLQKHCGVCAADDMYYGSKVVLRESADMPKQGANESQIVSITTNELEPRAAVWKPEEGEDKDLVNWVNGPLFARAEAAYLVDRELAPNDNMYLIPVTFTAEIDGVRGSVQHYLTNPHPRKTAEEYEDRYKAQAAVLDYVTGQVDRVNKNWLTHPTENHRPVLIDSDLSFPEDENMRLRSSFVDACAGQPIPEDLLDSLYSILGNHDLWDDLLDVLGSEKAVNNARARAQRLFDERVFPAANSVKVVREDGEMENPVKVATEEDQSPRMIDVIDTAEKLDIFETMLNIVDGPVLQKLSDPVHLAEEAYLCDFPDVDMEKYFDVPDIYYSVAPVFMHIHKAEWEEEKHPRANDGKFTSGNGGGGSGGAKEDQPKGKPAGTGTVADAMRAHYKREMGELMGFAFDKSFLTADMSNQFKDFVAEGKYGKDAYQVLFNMALMSVRALGDPDREKQLVNHAAAARVRGWRKMKALRPEPKPVKVGTPEPAPAPAPEPAPAPAPDKFAADLAAWRKGHYEKAAGELFDIANSELRSPDHLDQARHLLGVYKSDVASGLQPEIAYKNMVAGMKAVAPSFDHPERLKAAADRARVADWRKIKSMKVEPKPVPVAPAPAPAPAPVPPAPAPAPKMEAAHAKELKTAETYVYSAGLDSLKSAALNYNKVRGDTIFDPDKLNAQFNSAEKSKAGFAEFVGWMSRTADEYEKLHGKRKPTDDPLSARIAIRANNYHENFMMEQNKINSKYWKPIPLSKPELHRALTTNKISSKKLLFHKDPKADRPGGGVNESYLCQIDGDGRAIVKPDTGKGYGSASNEVYAYSLADALGFDIVPVTTYRTWEDGRKSSAQSFVDNATIEWETKVGDIKMSEDLKDSFSQMVVMDCITGNADRHGGNWLYSTDTGKIVAIDNGFSGLHTAGKFGTGADKRTERTILGRALDNWQAILVKSKSPGARGGITKRDMPIKKEHIDAAEKYINSSAYEDMLRDHFSEDHTSKMIVYSKSALNKLREIYA